ncbi:hypothetical protein HNV10_05725 [Winogradskyella litoriviva]|uniref:Uncharacterized protein n=1 Tax=Winogradskyella litoriviva TaxID=1220182 RepID=A0ABX2E4L9_9FLAO|nr:hypothetical protein [Winogradskyella litoriviva]NRD22729.1 hypothetical protein [Winogradskyella litoriviva]
MKKIILTLLITLPLLSFGQKIKIKKGIVTFDGKEVAKLDDNTRDHYKFTTLTGDKAFDVVFKGMSASNLEGFQWLEMTSATGKKTEIPYEVLMTSFSVSKLIIKLLSEKYKLITSNGIDMAKVDEFFAVEREVLSDKYAQAVVAAKTDEAERQKTVGKYNPFVKDDGTVLFGGSQGTNIVGRASFYNNTYTVKDLDGIVVGTAKGCSTCTAVDATTYTDESFKFDYGSKTMMTGRFSRSFAQIFVEELLGRGYTLGHEAKAYKKRLHNERVNVAKEQSINLYGVAGKVTDDEGKIYKGTIYAVFEKLELDQSQQESGIYDTNSIDNYGKFVSVKYKNEKNRDRIKKFAAKDNVTFCADDEGIEKCFMGMKTKGNALKKLSNASNLGFDNSYFYEIIYEKNGHMVLSKPGEEGTYVLKFTDQKVGFMIDSRKNDKISEKLAKFVANCKNLSEDINNGEFDLSNLDNLKQIVDEYCKK